MAAFESFLELDPVDMGPSAGAQPAFSPPPAAATDTAAATAAGPWAWKRQKLLKFQAQPAADTFEEDDADSLCTSSPGCSYSGGAGLEACMLELADDACSAPHRHEHPTVAQQFPAALQQPAQQQQQPSDPALVAATFWDDLAAGGSVFQYCLQQQ